MPNHTPELTPELLAQIKEYADNDLPIGSTTAKEWLRAQQAEIERLSKENKIYRRKNSIWGFDVADRNVREAEAALQQSREENERLRGALAGSAVIANHASAELNEARNKLQQIDGQRMDAEAEVERLRGLYKRERDIAERLRGERDSAIEQAKMFKRERNDYVAANTKLYSQLLSGVDGIGELVTENEILRGELEQIKAERDDYRKVLEWYGGGSEDGGEKARDILLRYKRGDGG